MCVHQKFEGKKMFQLSKNLDYLDIFVLFLIIYM